MNLQTPIQPVETSKPATVALCQFVIVNFGEGDQYAHCRILLNDEDGSTVASHQVNFTAEELAGWGTDDTFVINLALDKLGIAHQNAALVQQ